VSDELSGVGTKPVAALWAIFGLLMLTPTGLVDSPSGVIEILPKFPLLMTRAAVVAAALWVAGSGINRMAR
jgi:hypothetical protein